MGQASCSEKPGWVEDHSCANGPHSVSHGWTGAGHGANYCNLCRCHLGKLACTAKACGAPERNGWVCSHTFCVFGPTASTHGEDVMRVLHHHQERHGVQHHCAVEEKTGACACHCFTDEQLTHDDHGHFVPADGSKPVPDRQEHENMLARQAELRHSLLRGK